MDRNLDQNSYRNTSFSRNPKSPSEKRQRGPKIFFIIIAVVLLGMAAFLSIFYLKSKRGAEDKELTASTVSETLNEEDNDTKSAVSTLNEAGNETKSAASTLNEADNETKPAVSTLAVRDLARRSTQRRELECP